MSRPETCRIAAAPADYQRYGIAKGEIAAWEDGFRTRPGGPGTFEWWYFDAVLDDGSTLVINFMVKDIRGGRGISQPARPVVSFELDRPDGTYVERALHAQDDFAFAADRCDVRVGACTFAGDLHTYRIHLELDAVTADVTLTGQASIRTRSPASRSPTPRSTTTTPAPTAVSAIASRSAARTRSCRPA